MKGKVGITIQLEEEMFVIKNGESDSQESKLLMYLKNRGEKNE